MRKFKAELNSIIIEPIDILSETKNFVVVQKGKHPRRVAKITEFTTIRDTFEQARADIVEYWENRVRKLNAQLTYEADRLSRAHELKTTEV